MSDIVELDCQLRAAIRAIQRLRSQLQMRQDEWHKELTAKYVAQDKIAELEAALRASDEVVRDYIAEHDNECIEQPDAKTLHIVWARNNNMIKRAREATAMASAALKEQS